MESKQQRPCQTCGGSGQINFFKGESRFLLSVEECPACCGFGYVVEEDRKDDQGKESSRSEERE